MRRILTPLAAWTAALSAIIFTGGQLVDPPQWLRWGAVASFGLLLPATLWLASAGVSAWSRRDRHSAFFTFSAICVVIAAAGGGVGSLASLAIVFPLVLSLDWFGRERTAGYAIVSCTVLLLLDILAIGRALIPESSMISLLAVGGMLLFSSRGTRSPRGTGSGGDAAGDDPGAVQAAAATSLVLDEAALERAASSPDAFSGADPIPAGDIHQGTEEGAAGDGPEPATHLAPDMLTRRVQPGSRQWWRTGGEYRVVADYLLDVRASTGAEEAVVWLLNDSDNVLRPLAACSSSQWGQRANADDKWMALVRWSAEAAVVQCGELEDSGGYVTAPVAAEGKLLGVLCLRRRGAFEEAAEQLKARAAHHASCVARIVSLIEMHTTSTARTTALDSALDAVRDLQDHVPLESPASAICDAILHVCGCDASALVRWYPEIASGSVEAGAGAFESFEQSAVQLSSIVGSTCQRATPFRMSSSLDLLSRVNLFRQEERLAPVGALCVQPLRRDGEVLGALVASWNDPTDRASYTASSMEVLASVAAHALHAAWRLETVQIAARTDPLTGLSNRRYLDEQMARVLAESSRYGDPASLILLDLDYFKAINDTHGHAVGDLVLKHVAETLLDGVRGVDLCARYGGEELAVLLPRTGLEGAVELAERLRSMVELRPVALQGEGSVKVTASFGVASFPSHGTNAEALLSCADDALYRAKEAGRNRVRTAAVRAGSQGGPGGPCV